MNTDVSAPPPRPRGWRGLLVRAHELVLGTFNADTTPARIGAAVGLGVLFGCSPFFGFQMLLALAVAWPLRLNKLGVILGTQISIPPLIPFIVFGGANLGELMIHGRALPMTMDALRAIPPTELAKQFFVSWVVGGLTLGAILGAILGTIVALVVQRRRMRSARGNS